MEPTTSIHRQKRKRDESIALNKCIICQTGSSAGLRQSSSRGIESIKYANNVRLAHNCDRYIDAIDRLQSGEVDLEKALWHKDCFSSFTSKERLERLKRHHASVGKNDEETATRTRSSVDTLHWEKCIFCQAETGDSLHQVMTFEASAKVLNGLTNNTILSYRLAGVSDLVAAEAKYHLKCYVLFCRKREKGCDRDGRVETLFDPPTFSTVVKELQTELNKGNVFSVRSVWDRYCQILTANGIAFPAVGSSNVLRSFRNDLKACLGDAIEFVENTSRKDSLLILPNIPRKTVLKNLVNISEDRDNRDTEGMLLKNFSSIDDSANLYRSLYHLSSQVKADIKEVKGCTEYDVVDKTQAESLIPQSLFLLVSMLLGENDDPDHHERILSIAQDIIFVSSKGRKLTPKHIGIGISLHHATRSKSLVELLHAAGHCVSYECVQRIDTSIAKSEIDRYTSNNKVVIPRNLLPGKFVQFAGDNINVLEETLDGKGQFNATQMVAFQEKSGEMESVVPTCIGKERSITSSLPPDFHELLSCGYASYKRPSPILPLVDPDWYRVDNKNEDVIDAKCRDISWIQCRMESLKSEREQVVPAWTGFNQIVSRKHSEPIEVGYMPIIPAPADDMDTVYTVLAKCKYISEYLGQNHTVVTFDQALYCKAKELVWLKPDEFGNTIIRLGGFHVIMNFMKSIGQHLDTSGLKDIWVESGVFGGNTAEHMLDGKAYNKAVRGHKLAVEALWRILWGQFVTWAEDNQKEISGEITQCSKEVVNAFSDKNMETAEAAYERLVALNRDIVSLMKEFESSYSERPTFTFWLNYMEMVSTLLNFIRAEREGRWELHLLSFARMLPWFAAYNHTNYARWGPVYLADMRQLPTSAPYVHQQFVDGKFSVQRTNKKFSQVSTDQALEHVNKVSKVSGGIIGITRCNSARDKWCLTFNEKARLAEKTFQMFNLHVDEDIDAEWCHLETGPTRLKRDEQDVQKLVDEFQRFEVFSQNDEHSEDLICLTTKDIVPDDIKQEIVNAPQYGLTLVESFVTSRLIEKTSEFYAKLPRNKTPSISNMYKVQVRSKSGKQKEFKADRQLIQRLLVASQSGRDVDLTNILQHELSAVPRAIAGTHRKLHTADKAQLQGILRENVNTQHKLPKSDVKTCLLIDGPALIQAIGKPEKAKTFGDLSDTFCKYILDRFGPVYSRIDVLFDRYNETSIKSGTRANRAGSVRPVRRVITSKTIKLPSNWKSFISLPANKADLADFLSRELVDQSQLLPPYELVLAGGFANILDVWSSAGRQINHLKSTQEEADTRLILHAVDAGKEGFERVVLQCRDTDVLVLALGFRDKLPPKAWMFTGASSKHPYIPVHDIKLPDTILSNIIQFHALTGCDTVSQFSGIGKRSSWKVFCEQPQTLNQLGSRTLTHEVSSEVETFVCRLYTKDCDSVNEARHKMFVQGKRSLDTLPPTRDALERHIARANYQSLVWKEAATPIPDLPHPTNSGWVLKDGALIPDLMSLEPVPKVCKELISCNCKSGCGKRCGCQRAGQLTCTTACACQGLCSLGDDE